MRNANGWAEAVATIIATQQVSESDYYEQERDADIKAANCEHVDSEYLFDADSDVPVGWACHDCGDQRGATPR